MSRLVSCAIVLTCYAIMAFMATAPHGHGLVAAGGSAALAGPSGPGGGDQEPSPRCNLCTWSRVPAPPAPRADVDHKPPSAVAHAVPRARIPSAVPQARTVSLRAPPVS